MPLLKLGKIKKEKQEAEALKVKNANLGVLENLGPKLQTKVPEFVKNSVFDPGNPAGTGLQGSDLKLVKASPVGNIQNVSPAKLEFGFSTESNSLSTYFDIAINEEASDVHLSVGYPPLLRINGKLSKITGSNILSVETVMGIIKKLLGDVKYQEFSEKRELDFSVNYKDGIRFRGNIYFESGNVSAVFRLISSNIKNIEELYLPAILHKLIKLPHGLVLATGPTGTGKSTTLAAMLNEINMSESKHIITIEDPIEYIYPKGLSLIDQREIGRDTLSWKNALKSTLRQDPDIVMVGEMRDFETIASTITIAETGHLVFSTLHTNSASQALDRIIDVFPEHQQVQVRGQLANVLSAVISQRLIPLEGGGRRVVCEILIGTPAVKNAIREGKVYQIDNMILTGGNVGMISLEKSLVGLIKLGLISVDTAIAYTTRPDELKQMLGI